MHCSLFKVEYLWNSWVKKDVVNANLVLCDRRTLDTPIDFAFSPRLSLKGRKAYSWL